MRHHLATEHQLQVLNAIDRFEDSKRKVRVFANQLKADLKLTGNVALGSEPPTDYTRFNPNQAAASVGLELDLPIDRLLERNVIEPLWCSSKRSCALLP